MIDRDLAILYDVETKVFNKAVKRNIKRFPEKFRFQLTEKEFENLRSQFVTLESQRGKHRKNIYFMHSQSKVYLCCQQF